MSTAVGSVRRFGLLEVASVATRVERFALPPLKYTHDVVVV